MASIFCRRHALWIAALLACLTGSAYGEARPPKGPPPPPAPDCGPLLPFLTIGWNGASGTIYGQPYGNALLFAGGFSIDADGAPNAYHPDNVSGLDALANAGGPGGWWALATDLRGRPFVQGPGDPSPGFYVSKTALTDPSIGTPANPRRYVDSSRVPYITLPGGERAARAFEKAGFHLGDFVLVYNTRTQKTAGAVWADRGPSDRLGEGSIALARALGYADASPRTGGSARIENLYLLFPGTGTGFPRDPRRIDAGAMDLLLFWGGLERLNDCAHRLDMH